MQQRNFFLRTKLLPPRAVSDQLARPRLVERLRTNLNLPISMVAADAGCGKTTLVAEFLRGQSRPSVWYQLDHTDADPFVFLGYVTEGIKSFAPNFGETIGPYLAEAGEEVIRFPERAADLFLNEVLESIENPFILVLDDYHHIGTDTAVHKVVDRILQYSSDMLHVIITTRDFPPLAIMRRRSQFAAGIITRDDLLFTDDEVRELFRQTLNVELKDEEIAEYSDRTHGWITALQLVRQIAEQELHGDGPGSTPDLRDVLKRSERDVFDYFAEEVFSREDETTRSMLMHLSLLDSMPLDVCSAVFPELRCSASLPALAQKNVFVTVGGEGKRAEVYRFHPLFRDFLIRRLRSEIGQAKLADERSRIAEYFLDGEKWDAGIGYLIESENFDRAAEIIARTGDQWIARGAIMSLAIATEQIAAASLEKFPRSLLWRAEVLRLQGDIDRSAALLHKAVTLLAKARDAVGEAEALHALASVDRRRRKYSEALALLTKAEKLVPKDSETYLKCANTRGLCLINQRNWNDAEQQFRFALDLAEKQSNEHYIRLITHNLALGPGFRGDFGEALRWFKRIFRDGQPDKQLPQEAIGHLNVARLHLYRGELDDAERHLNRSLELGQLYNLRFLLGEIFEQFGNLYREREDLAHTAEYYERALKAYEDAEVDIASRELNEERAFFALLHGDTTTARGILENLIEARKAIGYEIGVYTARSMLTRVGVAEGRFEGLIDEISEVLKYFHDNNHYYEEALASLTLADAYCRTGEQQMSLAPLQRVLDLSARYDYEYWLRGQMRSKPDLFRQEDIAERLPADLRAILQKPTERRRKTTREMLAVALEPVTDLTVKVLGPVDIFRDATKPFAADAWTTRRARDIFCYIATSKHRRVAKDILIEAFWPDEDPAVIEKNFHPTISHIRKALNSRQAFKQNFLVFRDGSYQLNPEMSYSIDCEEFERHVADAETAKRDKDADRLRIALEGAFASYRGEFMPGIYDGWAEERRGYYSEQFSRVLSALAKQAVAEKRWAAALKFAGEILNDDPYREDIHRLIMKVLAAQGKPAAVKDQFDDLSALLKKDLGIDPATETRRVFQELLK